jgi:hypothetical protein
MFCQKQMWVGTRPSGSAKIRQTMAHPVIGNYTTAGRPVRFGDAPAVRPAPLLGRGSGNALAEWLKMDDVAIGATRRQGQLRVMQRLRRSPRSSRQAPRNIHGCGDRILTSGAVPQ